MTGKNGIKLLLAAAILAGIAWVEAAAKRRLRPVKSPAPAQHPPLPYRGNSDSRVFHLPACRYYSAQGCTETFASREEALGAEFKPCSLCTP